MSEYPDPGPADKMPRICRHEVPFHLLLAWDSVRADRHQVRRRRCPNAAIKPMLMPTKVEGSGTEAALTRPV